MSRVLNQTPLLLAWSDALSVFCSLVNATTIHSRQKPGSNDQPLPFSQPPLSDHLPSSITSQSLTGLTAFTLSPTFQHDRMLSSGLYLLIRIKSTACNPGSKAFRDVATPRTPPNSFLPCSPLILMPQPRSFFLFPKLPSSLLPQGLGNCLSHPYSGSSHVHFFSYSRP